MAYLNYISDQELEDIVKQVLDKGMERKNEAEEKFTDNVIDPFGCLFEASAFYVDHETWKKSETIRQCQKTLQNHIGNLHQQILGRVKLWEDLGTGGVIDLVCHEKKIIAEVKNKYNTVTGGKLSDQYYSLERLIMPKVSVYRGYTAFFVNIIPAKPVRFNQTFQPSDKEKSSKCAENKNIRHIDGASFYQLVTGQETALADLHAVLPTVISKIFEKHYNDEKFKIADENEFAKYYDLAYKDKNE